MKLKRPVATLIDLQGQKIRIKGFGKKEHILLKAKNVHDNKILARPVWKPLQTLKVFYHYKKMR